MGAIQAIFQACAGYRSCNYAADTRRGRAHPSSRNAACGTYAS